MITSRFLGCICHRIDALKQYSLLWSILKIMIGRLCGRRYCLIFHSFETARTAWVLPLYPQELAGISSMTT
jgi:hypothetical protein